MMTPGLAMDSRGWRHSEDDAWRDRRPLSRQEEPSDLPVELLPEALKGWITDAAERLQIPLAMIGAPAMVGAGNLIGRGLAITPKRRDDWAVVPNLWGMIVGRPGLMKTAALREALRFVDGIQARASDLHREAAAEAAIDRDAIDAEIGRVKRSGKPGALDETRAKLLELGERRASFEIVERRFTTQDATPEKLGELLVQNPRGLLVLRDELAGWLYGLQKSGRETERQFFLEGWNGDGRFTVDRIGRGTLHIPALALGVLGTIQPAKVSALLVDNDADGGDGLVQRFSIAVWPEPSSEWLNVDRAPNYTARDRARRVFEALADLNPVALGANADRHGVPRIGFANDAQELFDAWREDLERRLRSDELREAGPSFEGHLSKYRKAMPALALISHLADVVDGAVDPGPVSLVAAKRSAAWCDFLESHARKLFAVEVDPVSVAIRALARRVERGDLADGTTLRDLKRCHWAGLADAGNTEAAVDALAELGWLRRDEIETGGRSATVIRLHPELRGAL